MSANAADWLGVGSVVVAITYLSLIVGELVPKQIALRAPGPSPSRSRRPCPGCHVSPLPLVWLLDASGKACSPFSARRAHRGNRYR